MRGRSMPWIAAEVMLELAEGINAAGIAASLRPVAPQFSRGVENCGPRTYMTMLTNLVIIDRIGTTCPRNRQPRPPSSLGRSGRAFFFPLAPGHAQYLTLPPGHSCVLPPCSAHAHGLTLSRPSPLPPGHLQRFPPPPCPAHGLRPDPAPGLRATPPGLRPLSLFPITLTRPAAWWLRPGWVGAAARLRWVAR